MTPRGFTLVDVLQKQIFSQVVAFRPPAPNAVSGHCPPAQLRLGFSSRLVQPLDTSGPITYKVGSVTAKRNIGGWEGGEWRWGGGRTLTRDRFIPKSVCVDSQSLKRGSHFAGAVWEGTKCKKFVFKSPFPAAHMPTPIAAFFFLSTK